MKKIKNKIAIASLLITSLGCVNNAYAVDWVIDTTLIGKVVTQTQQAAMQHAEQMIAQAKQTAQDLVLQGQNMQNQFNNAVMQTGAITDTQTNIYNKSSLKELTPNFREACIALTLNRHLNEVSSEAGNSTQIHMNKLITQRLPRAGELPNPETSGVPTPKKWSLDIYKDLNALDVKYAGLNNSSSGNRSEGQASVYLNPTNLFTNNMSKDESFIAQKQLELLEGGPENPLRYSELKEAYKQDFVKVAQKTIYKNMAVYAIQDIIDKRKVSNDGQDSVISTNQAFINTTIKDQNWIKKFTNTDKNIQNLTTTSQVLRESLRIDAQRLAVQSQSQEELEQIKGLLAVQGLISLNGGK